MTSAKTIICADAMEWLETKKCAAIFTSPPDAEEIGHPVEAWAPWFRGAIALCFAACSGPLVFYVTDRKSGGRLHSKAAMVLAEADQAGVRMAWHKIALRRDVGQTDLHRPTFTHLLAFNGAPGKASPDVIQRGKTVYPNGTGLVAARVGVEWVKKQVPSLLDPFCGQGTIPAVAEALGLTATGVDIDEAQCAKARALTLRLA